MKVIILILKMLTGIFGQDKLWSAFEKITERRGKIKLEKFDEKTEIRKLKNEISESKLEAKKKRKEKKRDKRGRYVSEKNVL